MTNDEILIAIQGYINKWTPLLGLENWRIVISLLEQKDTAAKISWMVNYRKARLFWNSTLEEPELELRPDIMEASVVHELVHLLLARVRDVIDNETTADSYLWKHYSAAEESVVDELTSVILRLGR